MTPLQRIMSRVEFAPTGCWLWLGSTSTNGYPQIRMGKAIQRVHLVMYELFYGPVPEGLEADHQCNDTMCVNPAHLFAMTHLENCRRYFEARTHCKHGHEFTPENTRVRKNSGGYTVRECRECGRIRDRRRSGK